MDPEEACDTTDLIDAARTGDYDIVLQLLEQGADVAEEDEQRRTALHLAASRGHRNVVRLLIEKHSDVNKRGKYGHTPLTYAARNGHKEVVQDLIIHGAIINQQGHNGNTAAHEAAHFGWDDVVMTIMKHDDADLQILNNKRQTVMHDAAFGCYKSETIHALIRVGLSIEDQDEDGYTPLHFAVEEGNWEAMVCLLEAGARNKEDNDGDTPLYLLYSTSEHSHLRKEQLRRYLAIQHLGTEVEAREFLASLKRSTSTTGRKGLRKRHHHHEEDDEPDPDENVSVASIVATMEQELHKKFKGDIKECIWCNLGATKVSQDVIAALGTGGISSLLTDPGFLDFLLVYFVNLSFDIFWAKADTWGSGMEWIAWIFRAIIIAPSFVYLFNYIPKRWRTSDLRLQLHDLRDQKALYDPDLPGRWFLHFYERRSYAILASVFQLWPIIIFCHRRVVSGFVDDMKKRRARRAAVFDRHRKALDFQIELIERWNFFEFTANLVIWLYTSTPENFFTVLLFFKITVKTKSIIFYLFEEESSLIFPAEISDTGKVFLYSCFTLRVLARVFCIRECLRMFGVWTFLAYPIHVFATMFISYVDLALHRDSCCPDSCESLFSGPRFMHACLSLYNYIPPKLHKQRRALPGRVVHVVLLFLQDIVIVSLVYALPLESDHQFLLGKNFGAIVLSFWFISFLFLLLYYKRGHPWFWRRHVLPF